jgi:DNA-binding NtrC family response regulator
VVPVHLPPLRERTGDIPLLAQHFLQRFAMQYGKEVREISSAAMTILLAHEWPGNVRELENAFERAVILARGPVLEPGDLPPSLTASAPAPSADRPLSLKRALEIPEREIILRTLRGCGWNRQETARALGINRTTLYNKMRKYGLLEPRGPEPIRA